MTKYTRVLLLASLFVSVIASAQQADYGKINAYISKAVSQHKIPGLAIGIVENGEIVFQQGYGVCKAGETKRVNTTSMFGIASLSKAFTAASLGQLVDQGKIKWTDKVTTYLPDWKLYDEEVTNMFTIEDLLCHRSGLKTFDGDLLWYGTNYSREEIITRVRHLPLSYEYRAGFGYQNIMYITAGEVIEKVSGMSWDDYLKKNIFEPLGMNKTCSSISEYKDTWTVAYPHIKGVPQTLIDYNNSGATAALNSNVVDMEKWMLFWLNNGMHDGDTLLQPATIRKIWSVMNPLPVSGWDEKNGTHFKGYGMGWFLFDYQGMKIVHHGGGLPGYITKVALIPERNIGIVILTNDMSSVCTALMYKLIDIYSGSEEERDWSREFAGYSKAREKQQVKLDSIQDAGRKADQPASMELLSYAGSYSDSYYGAATVTLEGKGKKARLKMVLEPAKELFTAQLEHWEGDTWVFQFNDPFLPRGFVNFELKEGKCEGFTIDLENPDFHFSNLHFVRQ